MGDWRFDRNGPPGAVYLPVVGSICISLARNRQRHIPSLSREGTTRSRPADHLHRRGLACTVGTQQPEGLTGGNLERQPVHGEEVVLARDLVGLDEVVGTNDGLWHRPTVRVISDIARRRSSIPV